MRDGCGCVSVILCGVERRGWHFSLTSAMVLPLDSLFFSMTMHSISVPAKPLLKFSAAGGLADAKEFTGSGWLPSFG